MGRVTHGDALFTDREGAPTSVLDKRGFLRDVTPFEVAW